MNPIILITIASLYLSNANAQCYANCPNVPGAAIATLANYPATVDTPSATGFNFDISVTPANCAGTAVYNGPVKIFFSAPFNNTLITTVNATLTPGAPSTLSNINFPANLLLNGMPMGNGLFAYAIQLGLGNASPNCPLDANMLIQAPPMMQVKLQPIPVSIYNINKQLYQLNKTGLQTNFATEAEATIINTQGQVVNKFNIKAGINSYEYNNLPNGIYFLKIKTATNQIATEKIALCNN
jgi:hypothetical protein